MNNPERTDDRIPQASSSHAAMKRVILLPMLLVMALASSACITRTSYVDLYGQAAPSAGADYTIIITPATKYINVEGGQTVNFIVGDKQFAWSFNVARTVHSFDLNEVAPPGLLTRVVRAYVSPDPKYFSAPLAPGE